MNKYADLSKENLIEKIEELEIFISELLRDKNNEELLNSSWVGNLGTWYWNVKSNSLICNEHKVLALNYEKDEIPEKIGFQFFTDKIHPDDYESVMDNMRQHLYGRIPAYEVEYRIQAKDGKWKWYYDRGIITKYDEDGKPLMVSGIVFDITMRKEMDLLIEAQNKKLLEIVNIDYLTQVYNRKALFEKLSEAVNKDEALSVLILDIDHFKNINDTYSHLAGDAVLKQAAKIIQESIRESDIVGRFGGEEFIVIFPKTDIEQGFNIAETIRQNIENSKYPDEIKVTISGGIIEHKNESVDKLLYEVDKALYMAKNRGRNQIVSCSSI